MTVEPPNVCPRDLFRYIYAAQRLVPVFGVAAIMFAGLGLTYNFTVDGVVYTGAKTSPSNALLLSIIGVSLLSYRPLRVSPPWQRALPGRLWLCAPCG